MIKVKALDPIRRLIKGTPAVPPVPPWNLSNGTPRTVKVFDPRAPENRTGSLEEDLEFYYKHGFAVIKNAVSREDCQALVDSIYAFLGFDPEHPSSWYQPILPENGMVEMYQNPAQWRIRESKKIYDVSAAIYGTHKLWSSMDRINFKVPVNPKHPRHDSSAFIHWDFDSRNIPDQLFLQGVLMLVDTDASMGGFRCVPGLFGDTMRKWVAEQPAERDPIFPDLNRLPEGMEVTAVEAEMGDWIVWDSTLAHGSGRNLSNRARLAQYVSQTLIPTGENYKVEYPERINAYNNLTCIPRFYYATDPRGWEKAHYGPPELSDHGKKLLGVAEWD